MKPIKQTKFGDVEGNCFAACLASILEVPLDDVAVIPSAEEWLPTTQRYLKSKGLYYLEVRLDVAKSYPMYNLPDGIDVIFYGKAARGFDHAVVGTIRNNPDGTVDFVPTHDPHPDNSFLTEKPRGIGFLCTLTPSQL